MALVNDQLLWITAAITVGYQLLFFAIASLNRFDKVTDFAGGSNFAINAIVTLTLAGVYSSKRIVATVCVLVWAVRLAVFLLLRVLRAGDDKRFDEMRDKFWAFLGFWVFQMFWVWTVSLSLTLLNASDDTSAFGSATDIAGLVLFVVGFLAEAVSDQQKFWYRFDEVPRFKEQNPGKVPPICIAGLWKYSRQPNYFGEILLWWGMFILCLTPDAVSYASLASPIFITLLLLFVSGITLAERGSQKRYLGPDVKDEEARVHYLAYRAQTSVLIPLPTGLYRALPMWFKRVFLFEFPLYETSFMTSDSKRVQPA